MRAPAKLIVVLGIFGWLATAGQASAATIFGAKVDSLSANINCGSCTVVGLKHYDSTTDTGSTATGILTKVRIRYEGPAAAGVLRVQHPTGVPNEFRNDGETPVSIAAESTTGGAVQSFSTRTRIAIGDHLGVAVNAVAMYLHIDSDAKCASEVFSSPQPVGGNLTFIPGNCGGNDLLAEGTVEADADGDGFGDESQDLCPSDASTHATCPVPAPRKRCKKKAKRHSADAAKKKCKKRKK